MRLVSSEEAATRARLKVGQFADAIEYAFRAWSEGRLLARPKTAISLEDGIGHSTSVACWPDEGLALFSTVAVTTPDHVAPGEPHYHTTQVVVDNVTSKPLYVVDGSYASSVLPVAVTLLFGRRFARPESHVLALIGAGTQAHLHLEALCEEYPIRSLKILTRSQASADRLREKGVERGLDVSVVSTPAEALGGADLVVSTVPRSRGLVPFLASKDVSPGTFVSSVNLGVSWQRPTHFDVLLTDDREQARTMAGHGRLPFDLPYDADLGDVLAKDLRRRSDEERIFALHPGTVVGTFGMTRLLLGTLDTQSRPDGAAA